MLATIFFTFGIFDSFVTFLVIFGLIILSVCTTLFISKMLSITLLKGKPSHFIMEMPPYRKPKVFQVIYRSMFDKSLSVLGRAAAVAAPFGIVIWVLQNLSLGGMPLLSHISGFLDPLGRLMGMDGVILAAFILGIPANEIVIPIIIMCYLNVGSLTELNSVSEMGGLLRLNGWTIKTAVCTMLFSLNHFPCATTLLTIKKETKSLFWTMISFILPTVTGVVMVLIVSGVWDFFSSLF